jgi:flagellar L-ring protein precursor FlgH
MFSSDSSVVRGLLVFITLALAAGCNTMTPPATVHQPMTARPAPRVDHVDNSGSIYQPDGFRLALYSDRRAFYIGDTLTIVIQENTSASKKSSADASRTSGTNMTIPAVDGFPHRIFGGLAGASVQANSSQNFAGKGDAASNNLFTGNLAVTVIEVYPNGNLLVSGEKQVTINQGTEFIRFSGVVNPFNVSAGNNVASTNVADARIEYRGNGYINEAQTMGWLSRVFMTVWPF